MTDLDAQAPEIPPVTPVLRCLATTLLGAREYTVYLLKGEALQRVMLRRALDQDGRRRGGIFPLNLNLQVRENGQEGFRPKNHHVVKGIGTDEVEGTRYPVCDILRGWNQRPP